MSTNGIVIICFLLAPSIQSVEVKDPKDSILAPKPFASRFMIPVFSNSVPINGSGPTQFSQSLTSGMNLGFMSSISNFLTPVFQGLLTMAISIFALSGAAAVICSSLDCSPYLRVRPSDALPESKFAPIPIGIHHHNNAFLQNRLIRRKPFPPQPIAMQSLEEAFEKFD